MDGADALLESLEADDGVQNALALARQQMSLGLVLVAPVAPLTPIGPVDRNDIMKNVEETFEAARMAKRRSRSRNAMERDMTHVHAESDRTFTWSALNPQRKGKKRTADDIAPAAATRATTSTLGGDDGKHGDAMPLLGDAESGMPTRSASMFTK